MKLQGFIFWMRLLTSASLLALDSTPPPSSLKWPEMPSKESPYLFIFDLTCYGGLVNGLTEELVFAQTEEGKIFKLSQLDWKIQDLWIIGGRATVRLLDEQLFGLCCTLDGWGKAASRSSVMVDRDWDPNFSFETPSDISWSTSHLLSAYKVASELGFDLYQKKWRSAQLQSALLLGYQYFELAWKDKGGRYIYDYGTYVGFFPNETGISYSQEFSIPYLGLGTSGKWKERIQWTCYGKISSLAFVHQKDIHHLREITYDEKILNGTYWMLGALLSVSFSKYFDCHIKYDYEQMNQTEGITTIYAKDKPPKTLLGSGVYHQHQILSLGVSSSF